MYTQIIKFNVLPKVSTPLTTTIPRVASACALFTTGQHPLIRRIVVGLFASQSQAYQTNPGHKPLQ